MEKMESSQYEYLKVNKYFLCSIGQWPFQSPLEKFLIGIVFVPMIFTQTMFQVAGMITALNVDDIDAFTEGFAPAIISFMCLMKYINFFNRGAMKDLLCIMQDDWRIYMKTKEDCDILRRHYAQAKRVTFTYAASIYGSMVPFMILPTVLTALSKAHATNGTYERQLMFRIEYFLNTEKYYCPIVIHNYIGTLSFIGVVVACDSMVVQFIRHECGLCEILGEYVIIYVLFLRVIYSTDFYQILSSEGKVSVHNCMYNLRRLQHLVESNNLDIELYPTRQNDDAYKTLKTCAMLHKHIIQFAKTLETTSSMPYFFQLGFNMIGVSFTQFQAIVNLSTPSKSFRFVSFTVCLLNILLLMSLPGQHLTDYTGRIYDYIAASNWYQLSIDARKLLHIMLTKSIKPIQLTAGKIYTFNLMNFSAVLKTSFSYCMVLCSFS